MEMKVETYEPQSQCRESKAVYYLALPTTTKQIQSQATFMLDLGKLLNLGVFRLINIYSVYKINCNNPNLGIQTI